MALSFRRTQYWGWRGQQPRIVASCRFLEPVSHGCLFFAILVCSYGQQKDPAPTDPATIPGPPIGPGSPNAPGKMDKRAFGFVPNYKTADASLPYQRIPSKQKMSIAAQDSFDWTLFIVAAGYAGLGQLTDQNPSFGQGMAGYGNRLVRNYSDQVLGNLLVEGALPILLREDPRYFRRGQGTFWSRFGYAASRVFVTRTDSGSTEFNYSEIIGNSAAVGISNAYYPGSRNAGGNFQKFSIQIATDAVSNILKEFWPDVKRKLSSQHAGN